MLATKINMFFSKSAEKDLSLAVKFQPLVPKYTGSVISYREEQLTPNPRSQLTDISAGYASFKLRKPDYS